jgi:hypothetical protein
MLQLLLCVVTTIKLHPTSFVPLKKKSLVLNFLKKIVPSFYFICLVFLCQLCFLQHLLLVM